MKLGTEGSYLITGGLGALGLRVARWLVEQGARHVVLVAGGAQRRRPRLWSVGWRRAGRG